MSSFLQIEENFSCLIPRQRNVFSRSDQTDPQPCLSLVKPGNTHRSHILSIDYERVPALGCIMSTITMVFTKGGMEWPHYPENATESSPNPRRLEALTAAPYISIEHNRKPHMVRMSESEIGLPKSLTEST